MKYYIFAIYIAISQLSLAQNRAKVTDSTKTKALDEVVITATKQEEKLLQAPVSIEKLDVEAIKQSAQPSFFDAIQNLKGIQVITPSLGFKVINARGFANTTNVRFVQMVDGVDNQAPHIGAPIANSLGPNDLDIYRVEIVPGSASAMYGMNAINGIANFITKNPFRFQGISINQKLGINNFNSSHTNPTYYNETNLRIAKTFNQKIAFKINATFMKGTDWYADNRIDLNPNANISTGLTGTQNSGSDLVNQYGDEQGNRKTLTLGGKQYVVSRTGYAENEVANYGLQNIKADASVYYRPTSTTEISYTYRIANQNNIYQRTNRFRLDSYITQQQSITLKSNSIQFKTYLTTESTGKSYNIRSMAENIDRSNKTDNQWFTDFTSQYNTSTQNGMPVADAMTAARNFADKGRIQPNTDSMNNQISNLRTVNNWDIGAALQVKANLYHTDFQHDVTNHLLKNWKENYKLSLMYGLDFRDYTIVPDGNYFINPTELNKNINYWKVGGFLQATKLFFNEKVKINTVLRVDKNQYFKPKINPRLAVVYSPTDKNSFRISIQNGYRFPSIFEAFSNINSGGRKRVGGLPVMSNGIFENSYTQTSITAFQSAVQNDVNKNGLSQANAITENQNLLQKNNYTYLKPEQVTSFEMGYRTELLDKKLNIDIDFYYNTYQNLMAQIDANVAKTKNIDSVAINLQNTAKQDRYRLWTNSKTISYNYGSSFGISYQLPKKYTIGANFTYAKLTRKDHNDGLEDGFNTPEWMYNLSFGNPAVYKTLGFNINLRKQAAYLWQSALATGTVPSFTTIDAQVSADIIKAKLNLKIGASNLLNTYYYSFIGGSNIGGFYYGSVTYNLSW
jgi:outer membrane receptor protein involved in Fe transport